MRRIRGFTLIELMIVVGVVAILASIAVPIYNEQIRKSRRADAKQVQAVAEGLWYPMWDAGLKLGPSVHTPKSAAHREPSTPGVSGIVPVGSVGASATSL